METFSALLAICAGNSSVPGEFPAKRPVTRSFDVFFDLRLHGRLSKHSSGWWFETPSCPLWRHSDAVTSLWSIDHAIDTLRVDDIILTQRGFIINQLHYYYVITSWAEITSAYLKNQRANVCDKIAWYTHLVEYQVYVFRNGHLNLIWHYVS